VLASGAEDFVVADELKELVDAHVDIDAVELVEALEKRVELLGRRIFGASLGGACGTVACGAGGTTMLLPMLGWLRWGEPTGTNSELLRNNTPEALSLHIGGVAEGARLPATFGIRFPRGGDRVPASDGGVPGFAFDIGNEPLFPGNGGLFGRAAMSKLSFDLRGVKERLLGMGLTGRLGFGVGAAEILPLRGTGLVGPARNTGVKLRRGGVTEPLLATCLFTGRFGGMDDCISTSVSRW